MGTNGFTRNFTYNEGYNSLQKVETLAPSLIEDFTYDPCGNQITAGTTRNYSWNAANQLITYYNQAGSADPTIFAQYDYSGMNRVSKLIRTGTNINPIYERTIYIDGIFEYCILENGSTYEKNCIHLMDDQSRIAILRIGDSFPDDIPDSIVFNLDNYIGSSIARLDINGSIIDKEEYYPFGDSSLRTFSKKRYRYSGKEKDAESGLYYYEARYYAAWTCRFISCDPLMQKFPWMSAYVAFNNNPIFFKDPSGLAAEGVEGNPPILKLTTLGNGQKVINIFPETAYLDFNREVETTGDKGMNFYSWYFDQNTEKKIDVIIHHGNANIDPETTNKYDSGGKSGGHVMVHFEGYYSNRVYGFTGAGVKDKDGDGEIDKRKEVPLFPSEHPDPKLKGHYYSQIHGSEHYGRYSDILKGKIKNGGITSIFTFTATRLQFYSMHNFYTLNLNKDPYPYSIIGGERCASSVFKELMKVGLVSGNHGLSPKKLFNYLVSLNITVTTIVSNNVKDGTLNIDKIFTGNSEYLKKINEQINTKTNP